MIEICPKCKRKSLIKTPLPREVTEGKEKQKHPYQWACVICGFEEKKQYGI